MNQEHKVSPKCDCHRICLNSIQILYPSYLLDDHYQNTEINGKLKIKTACFGWFLMKQMSFAQWVILLAVYYLTSYG